MLWHSVVMGLSRIPLPIICSVYFLLFSLSAPLGLPPSFEMCNMLNVHISVYIFVYIYVFFSEMLDLIYILGWCDASLHFHQFYVFGIFPHRSCKLNFLYLVAALYSMVCSHHVLVTYFLRDVYTGYF